MFLENQPKSLWSVPSPPSVTPSEPAATKTQSTDPRAEFHDDRTPMSRFGEDDNPVDEEEDYHSALSHISQDDESSAGNLTNRPKSSSLIGQHPLAEPQRKEVLGDISDEENERLNIKIDQLLAAVQQGRTLHFDPSAENGEVDIFAGPPDVHSSSGKRGQKHIAASAPKLRNVIARGNRRQVVRSINSPTSARSGEASLSNIAREGHADEIDQALAEANSRLQRLSGGSFDDWETVSSTSSENPKTSSCPPTPRGIDINRRIRRQELKAGEPRGRRFGRLLDPDVVEVHSDNYPLPLDYNKRPRSRTPSVESADSVVESSSPLFSRSSYAELLRMVTPPLSADIEKDSGANESVLEWLEEMELPQSLEVPKNKKGKGAFGVFKDQTEPRKSEVKGTASQILKDVSNLRQPGYLKYNSFAQEKGKAQGLEISPTGMLPAQSFGKDTGQAKAIAMGASSADIVPTESSRGAMDPEGRRSHIESRWPELLTRKPENPTLVAQNPISQNLINEDQDPASQTTLNQDPLDPNSDRAAHFEHALARLEGRAPPQTSLPPRHFGALDGRDTPAERHEKGLQAGNAEATAHMEDLIEEMRESFTEFFGVERNE